MMNKIKSTILSIMNPRVTELKPPIENQEFLIVDRYSVSIYLRGEAKKDDLDASKDYISLQMLTFNMASLSI